MTVDHRLRQIVDWLRAIAALLGVILCTMIWVASGH